MDQEEIERLAFLYLCNSRDRAYINGVARMGYREFERLQFLAMSLGFMKLDVLFWRKQKENVSKGLVRWPQMYEIDHPSEEVVEDEMEKYRGWVKDFCDAAPTKRIRERLREVFEIWMYE